MRRRQPIRLREALLCFLAVQTFLLLIIAADRARQQRWHEEARR